ncbi:UV excision repair protein RAD23 homolog A [Phlebotomus argentipes]|uniref:UV excision repair protein RAD23 homolog A n=1 Tax=Phlebotomus argentipes TaxID=94469 RepID=UPI002893394A|nr:UV excision repair protein RAD23 homolog A [Phlebotomus argentipes]
MSTILITIKTLQQHTFQIEFDVTQTVRQLKEKIEEERGRDFPADGQLLIYGGVRLDNTRTVASYNVEERKFIVLMLQKSRQTKESEPESSTKKTEEKTPEPTGSELSKEAAKMSLAEASESPMQVAESRLLMGNEYNNMVDNLVEMGYTTEQVHKALQASFNNPERAVEYLLSGIPEDAAEESLVNEDVLERRANASGRVIDFDDPLDFLREQPQFHQMRYLIQQNPSFLHTLLQQVGQTNPALLRLISENQETFVNMLNEPYDPDNHPAATVSSGILQSDSDRSASSAEGVAPEQSEAAGTAPTSDTNPYNLTPEDIAAIERLKELGFSEQEVIEAYLACGKNENVAANFLFS